MLTGSAVGNRLDGNGGVDKLFGGDGDDKLNGGNGADQITGGAGKDVMQGDAAADTFLFLAVTDSAAAGPRDVITDFVQGTDKIDLLAIDAIAGGADDAFIFRGTGGFGASAGLKFNQTATTTVILADTNADQIADFAIVLNGVFTLVASDFVL